MEVTIKIKTITTRRPRNRAAIGRTFSLSVADNATVLDALIKIREEMDGTLDPAVFLPQRYLRFLRHAYQRPRRTRPARQSLSRAIRREQLRNG